MRGLCGYHRAQVARCPELAQVYWSRALQLAAQATQNGDGLAAHQAYACAFDIAKLRRADAELGLLSRFGEAALVETVLAWSRLSDSGRVAQAAAEALWFTHGYLKAKLQAPLSLERRAELRQRIAALAPFLTVSVEQKSAPVFVGARLH